MHSTLSTDDYAEIVERLKPDGALRDLLVLETTIDDWQCLVDFIRTLKVQIVYKEGDITLPPPMSAQDCFGSEPDRPTRLMSFQIAGMDLNCHFFAVDQIELDIDPRQIDGLLAVDSLLDFMCTLGRRLRNDVLLADEGSNSAAYPFWDGVICSYEAATSKLRIGCEPRPLLVSDGERAAMDAQDSWMRAFWARLRLLVRGWAKGLDVVGTGACRTIASVQISLLASDDDIFVVAGTPSVDCPNEWATIGSVAIDTRATTPSEAAEQTALELKEKILALLRRV
jgi:hypothetical protein